jgi:hypothetical protein
VAAQESDGIGRHTEACTRGAGTGMAPRDDGARQRAVGDVSGRRPGEAAR